MKLSINLSNSRIHQAIKDGLVLKSKMTIEVDLNSLSESDREILSRNVQYKPSEDIFYTYLLYNELSDSRSTSREVMSENITDIIELMKSLESARSAEIARQVAIIKAQAEIDDILAGIVDDQLIIERSSNSIYLKSKNFSSGLKFQDVASMLVFVKSDELILKLAEVKSEFSKKEKEASERAAAEAERKAAIEAGRKVLFAWANENGSDLLKLRVKHAQNWQKLAEEEWAIAHTSGFSLWADDAEAEEWVVNNANLEQLRALETSEQENPDFTIDMIRCKFMYEEGAWSGDDDYYHKTFLRIFVQTPLSSLYLFKEIQDADDK